MSNFQGITTSGVFNAQMYEPVQGGSKHPIGLFPAMVEDTDIISSKDGKSGMFKVTFKTPAGSIDRNYNLWYPDNPQVAEIAHKQLSALCHVTGRFQVNMANKGAELRGAQLSIEVGWQRDQEPGSEKGGPNGGYVEVKKVMDTAGNEPGKSAAPQNQPQQQAGWGNQPQQQPQQPQGQAPMQQQPGGGWATPNQASQQQPSQQQGGWSQQPPAQNNAPSWATNK